MAVPSGKRLYTITGLIKGTATLDELSTLLIHWDDKEPPVLYARRVQAEGILTKATSKRAEDIVLESFRPWFLEPSSRAALTLRALVKSVAERQILKELIFLYKARTEAVLYDYVTERFWNAYNEGALYLQMSEIKDFLQFAQQNGRVEHSWADYTRERLAYGILRALKEVGILHEEKRFLYAFAPIEINPFTVAYLAYDLHLTGLTDSALVEHSDWQLFGMNRGRVLERLSDLGEPGGMVVQQAGSVVRITWLYKSLDEVIHAYFG